MRLSIIFFYSMIFIGCNSNKNKNLRKIIIEPDTIYNVEIANQLWEKLDTVTSIVIDTTCIKEREKAKTDIKNGKLIYFHSKFYCEWKEMAELLSHYNIEYKHHDPNCFGPPPGFSFTCYEEEMWDAIYEKLGDKTIDSLWLVAEKEFVLKYPDSVYIKDGMDVRTKYLSK